MEVNNSVPVIAVIPTWLQKGMLCRHNMNKRMNTKIILAMMAIFLLSGCSGDDANDAVNKPASDEISFKIDTEQVVEGHSRATTFDNREALQGEGSFKCAAYNANTLTAYISPVNVNWSSDHWSFSDGSHTWPEGNLDFFAYMPATPPSYISSGPSYTADHNVTFSCSDLDVSAIKEFVYAKALGQNKTDNGSGVNLSFQHPFARIKLQWADYDHSRITLTSIKFKDVKKSGNYNESNSPKWAATGDATDLTFTAINDTWYLVVPQEWAGGIEVKADWAVWGETTSHTLNTTIPAITWEPGKSYTYTFRITETDLIVNIAKYTEQW
jgi:uncharacterized protein YceK